MSKSSVPKINIEISNDTLNPEGPELFKFRFRLSQAADKFLQESKTKDFSAKIYCGTNEKGNDKQVDEKLDKESITTSSSLLMEPFFSFDKLVFSDEVIKSLESALVRISDYEFIYKNWGLEEVDKNPRSAINLFGPPGTGKTAAAHAMADKLGKKIVVASYADIESKYHGEGPKNVQAIFKFALDNDAVLFIDEADSLLSKRLSNVTQGTEQAINSMRSQLLINMEMHKGLIVFATNFAENYDLAFDSRLTHVNIPLPDFEQRISIAKKHWPERLPKSEVFCFEDIASVEGVCGRDIKNSIILAAVQSRIDRLNTVSSCQVKKNLNESILVREELRGGMNKKAITISEDEKINIEEKIKQKIASTETLGL